MRRHLSRLIVAWLLCQVVGLAAAPLLVLSLADTAAVAGADQCTCPPGMAPGEACPMHHGHQGRRECVLRSALGTMDTALLSLLSSLGAIQPAPTIGAAMVRAESVAPAPTFIVARVERPESPPPRANLHGPAEAGHYICCSASVSL